VLGGNGPGGPVEDKYSTSNVYAGRFPSEESSSYEASRAMNKFRQAQVIVVDGWRSASVCVCVGRGQRNRENKTI
jgi:hypothetical protein